MEKYLHGLPNYIAPDVQRHVPAIMWFGSKYEDIEADVINKKINKKYTHDNIFHTVLGLMEINTASYDKSMDIIHDTN